MLPLSAARHALFACVGRMLGPLFMECRLVEAPLLQVPGYQSEDPVPCYARSTTRHGMMGLFELQVQGPRRDLMRDVNGLSGKTSETSKQETRYPVLSEGRSIRAICYIMLLNPSCGAPHAPGC